MTSANSNPGAGESAFRVERRGESGLTFRVIPCLDVRDGRVVKGVKFQNLRDQGDPTESAARYDHQGADEIVFLDITAAPEGRDTDLGWVRRTAEQVFIPLTVGGGVRKLADAERLLRSGADKVAVNTAAIENPELLTELAQRFGSQCVVLSVDAKRLPADGGDDPPRWDVVTHGGRKHRGLDALDWIARGVELGAGEILLTSIDADGTKSGYDLELLGRATERVRVPIIASGGAGTVDHLADAMRAGASAVLAASIFHEHTFTVGDVKRDLASRGFAMREDG
ncbi:MAG: imidazole glycerol phosphate synthase subunit HisF [Acidobacteriota bacterium]